MNSRLGQEREILERPPPPADRRLWYGPLDVQFGDLRLAAAPTAARQPLAIVIHGGFWRARYDLLHIGHLAAALTARGVATWSLEYRRVGNGGGWPATLEDVAAGAEHALELAREFPLDLDRVVTIGHSAGGHLALWLAAERTLRLQGAVALAGVVDLRRAAELGLGNDAVQAFLGGAPTDVPQRYRAASPR
ncbi:MAG: alpha/beta hydrolase, partial [Chloroflexota bacterium]|nr:alpha/beta hydrolase [Chloroflexota bacterium]